MSLRIAFDCDGVVADLDSALAEIVTRLFGQAPPAGPPPASEEATPEPPPAAGEDAAQAEAAGAADGPTEEEVQAAPARYQGLIGRQQRELWQAVRNTENFWESLAETEPGVVARLAGIARERGWEVIFITQRPASAGDTTQLQTQRWLAAHGFDLPSVYVIRGSRGKVAEALSLDVVVDDRPENCLDVKLESRARAILIWNEDLDTVPANARKLGIEPVAGLGACLDLLTADPPDKPGLFARIRQAIGA